MSRLKEILDIVTANSEEDIDSLLDMMSPQNFERSEMSEVFESNIGYDPISYYDKKRLVEMVEELEVSPDISEDVSELIKDSRESIVDEAYEVFDDNRDEYLKKSLDHVVEDKYGYEPDTDLDDEDDD